MNILQAVSSVYNNYFKLKGRASRAEFWLFSLFCFLTMNTLKFLALLSPSFVLRIGSISSIPYLTVLFYLSIVIPSFTVCIRRLHDINKSGKWMLLLLLPVVTASFIMIQLYFLDSIFISLITIASIISYVACCFLIILFSNKGTKGSNKYGPDPLAKDSPENLAV